MNTQNYGKADFYAFISHKSADAKFALKMQRFIESYQLPTSICKISNIPQRRLTPICSYEVDFTSKPLMDEMYEKLSRSKYLILICSEELLKNGTQYINYEIDTFIACKQAEGIDPLTRIIPVITTGEFGSDTHDCCPEALKALGDNCPIALDRKKYRSDRELFLHIMSALLDIDYAVIENRDKKRQRNKKLAFAAVISLLLIAGVSLGEYYIPRKAHYVDFVMRNGLPEGIGKLTADDFKQMQGHYVITTCQHKIESLEYVNAYGNRINHGENVYNGDRPSAYIFSYSNSELSAVTYEDKFGVPYFIMQYSGNSVSAADLRNPYDPGEAYYIGSGYESSPWLLLSDSNLSSPSDISRFRYSYSPEGYVTQIVFCADSTGRLAQDNSVYGLQYVLDEKGRITEVYFLDALQACRANSQGLYCRKFTYDDRNDLVEWTNHSKDGALTADAEGIVRCVYTYDAHHNLTGFSFYDTQGDPVFVDSYGGAGQKQYVNSQGNLILAEFLNESGENHSPYGYSAASFTYDENGFTASRTYQNEKGEAVMDPGVNYATVRYVNDKNGNPLEITFYDAQGNPINNAHGYAKEVVEYDSMGRQLKNAFFDADGNPADYRGYGYSSKVTVYDERGREISISYYGAAGEPVNTAGPIFGFGYHKHEVVYEYGAHTKQTLTYYDADNQSVNMQSSAGELYAKSILVVQNGEVTYLANYRSDGNLYDYILESETERSAQAEPITTVRYTDNEGNVLQETVMQYLLNGVEHKQTTKEFDASGNVIAKQEVIYYSNGQRQTESLVHYAADGTITSEYSVEYDEQGNVYKESLTEPSNQDTHTYIVDSVYDADGTLYEQVHTSLRSDGSSASVANYTFYPDGSKKQILSTDFDKTGKVTSKEEQHYENSIKTSSRDYAYNETGTVIMVTDTLYNSDGSTASMEFWDYDDSGLLFASSKFIYNADGTTTQITTFYDENQNVIDVSERLIENNSDN